MHVLITGMSGTGKSTVLNILRDRGYAAIETDETAWLVAGEGHDSEWLWDEEKVTRLLDTNRDTPLFIAGTRENQGRFYDRFAHIVLLSAPIEVMLDRVTSRTTNPFGSHQWEREKIAQDKAGFEPLLRAGATVELDTSKLDPDEIADHLEALL